MGDPELLRIRHRRRAGRLRRELRALPRIGGPGGKGYPGLADDDWLWGGSLAQIERTIRFGIRSTHPIPASA